MGASMTQHTPGPWTAEDIPGQPRHMFRIADAENCLICESESTRPDGWANARLIAKAPEMYAFIHRLVWPWTNFDAALADEARALLREIEGDKT